jgi:GTP-binding protein HflX
VKRFSSRTPIGFIAKLPHELVKAFTSTLDSVRLADLLVHVVDGSRDEAHDQIEAVREVLREIGAHEVQELLVINKADLDPDTARDVAQHYEGSVIVSAATGEGMEELVGAIGDRLRAADRVVTLRIPAGRGDLIAAAHREGDVVHSAVEDETVVLRVVLDAVGAARFAEWKVSA